MNSNRIYFIESDCNSKITGGIVIRQPFRDIDSRWKRILTYCFYVLSMIKIPHRSSIVAPWGLFWIPAAWKPIKKFTIISLSCDNLLSKKLEEGKKKGFLQSAKYRFMKKAASKVDIFGYCSGIVREQLENFGIDRSKLGFQFPAWVMPRTNHYEMFHDLKPNLSSNTFLFVGNFYSKLNQKRLDILMPAFLKLQEERDDVKLIVVGGGWSSFFNEEKMHELEMKGVSFAGRNYNIAAFLEQSAFYVHPGEYEAFGISILEAMLAGLIPVVSNLTGAKILVEKVDRSLIIPLTERAFYAKMRELISLKKDERLRLSNSCRKTWDEIDPSKSIAILDQGLQANLHGR